MLILESCQATQWVGDRGRGSQADGQAMVERVQAQEGQLTELLCGPLPCNVHSHFPQLEDGSEG